MRLATCGEMDALVGKCEEILRCERSDPDILEIRRCTAAKKSKGGLVEKSPKHFWFVNGAEKWFRNPMVVI